MSNFEDLPVVDDMSDPRGGVASDRVYAGDATLYVQFYRRAVYNPYKSAQEGRPIHDEADYIRIFVPGNKLSNIDTLATSDYQQRFATLWQKYTAGLQQPQQSGTPVAMLPEVGIGLAADLNALHITTVEQLAALSDTAAGKMQGLLDLREVAKTYIEASASAAVATKLNEQNQQLQARIADLEESLTALKSAKVTK